MYIKKLYKDEPLFENVKIVYSVFDNNENYHLGNKLTDKLLYEDLLKDDVKNVRDASINNLHKFAIDYSDAVVQGTKEINDSILSHIKSANKPFMNFPGNEEFIEKYKEFYNQFLPEEEPVEFQTIDLEKMTKTKTLT